MSLVKSKVYTIKKEKDFSGAKKEKSTEEKTERATSE